jgi:hypothetical protein
MPGTLEIEDARLYSEAALCHALGIRPNVLAEARAAGGLRSFKAGRRRLYKGAWILQWIESAGEPRESEAATC